MSSAEAQPPASKDLADRISKDEPKDATPKADEAAAPAKESSAAAAQLDGAPQTLGGSGLKEPEYDVDVKLADIQADPNNPLYSVKRFEDLGLAKEVLDGLLMMNFRKPSKIQERALPLLLANPASNMIGQSQSGTGKTAAFVLNILARVDFSTKEPQALVLAPSRELARQIGGVVYIMGQNIKNLEVLEAIPNQAHRGKKLEGQVVVGTPGTVMDLIRRRQLDASKMKVLVLDEADNMLDQQGLGDQCNKVRALLPPSTQIVLFSATFPENVVRYAKTFAPKANQITLKHEELTVEGIKQIYMDCNSEQHKYEVLVKLYGLMSIGSSIIFVKRRDTAAEIERRMVADGHQVCQLTGALEGSQRDAIIDNFRSGKAKVLITTNVLARGIDVQTVSMVVNYDIPEVDGVADPETYLHRIGRTGRFGRVGVAVSFVYDKKSWSQLNEISQYFGVVPTKIETDDWDMVESEIKKVLQSTRAGTNLQGSANMQA